MQKHFDHLAKLAEEGKAAEAADYIAALPEAEREAVRLWALQQADQRYAAALDYADAAVAFERLFEIIGKYTNDPDATLEDVYHLFTPDEQRVVAQLSELHQRIGGGA